MSNLTDFIGHNIVRSATEPMDKTKFWFNETDFNLYYYDYTNLAWVETTKQYGTINTFDIFGDGSAVALYQLDGNALDTGGAYNGTATSVTYGAGKFGQCVQYTADWSSSANSNSVSSGVTIDSTILASKTALSISMWVKSSDSVKPTIIVASSYTGKRLFNCFFIKSDATDYFTSGAAPTANTIRMHSGGNDNTDHNMDSGSYSFPLNQWNHVVLVFNGSNTSWEVYINNKVAYTFTNSAFTITGTTNAGDPQGFGCDPYMNVTSGDEYDQIRIFNRALTATEVNTLYTEV